MCVVKVVYNGGNRENRNREKLVNFPKPNSDNFRRTKPTCTKQERRGGKA